MWAGIDYSMTCPAITIGNSTDYNKCKTFYYTTSKKFEGKFGSNIYGMMQLPFETQMERFDNIAQWAMSILTKFKILNICLEDYSMGSKGRVFHIAENTGILKYHIWKKDMNLITVAPTAAKKFFTDKVNSNKEAMHDAFELKTGVSIADIMGEEKDKSPVSDIVDSYAMLCYGLST